MDGESRQSSILLTYKGKILLMYKSNSSIDKEKHPWHLIGALKEKSESFKNAVVRRVEKEMGIKVDKVEFVSESCYHARLTDHNVNNIKRAEGQLLNFFTLEETRKLLLSNTTQQLLSKYSALI